MDRRDAIHAAVALGPSLFFAVTFPLAMAWAVAVGKRRREAQKRRIEAYRKSPESHQLKL